MDTRALILGGLAAVATVCSTVLFALGERDGGALLGGIQINSGDPTKLAAATRISGAGICRIYRHQFETLTSGDVLSLSAFQASGGASAYTSGSTRDNYMAIMYVGPSS